MRKLQDLLVVTIASSALLFAVGCGDDSSGSDPGGGSGGTGGQAGQGGGNGGGNAGGGAGGGAPQGGGAGGGNVGGAGGGNMGAGGAGGNMGAGGMGGTPGNVDDPMGPINEWGPSARINFLDIPPDVQSAEASGCTLVGANKGTGLGTLVGLAGGNGLSDFVQPDENGEIQLLLLAQADGWAEGETVADVESIDLKLFNGEPAEDGTYEIDPDSFEGGDPANPPLIQFAGTSVDAEGNISSQPSTFLLTLPIMEGLEISVALASTQVTGRIFVDGPGFGLDSGVLGGYLTREGILELIQGIQALCGSDQRPDWCGVVDSVVPPGSPPETALDLILSFVGDFDARVSEDGTPAECDPVAEEGDPNACNAVSVCLLVEMQGETISGISQVED